eukprot:348447-Prorocentrum_minimum.AAC.1
MTETPSSEGVSAAAETQGRRNPSSNTSPNTMLCAPSRLPARSDLHHGRLIAHGESQRVDPSEGLLQLLQPLCWVVLRLLILLLVTTVDQLIELSRWVLQEVLIGALLNHVAVPQHNHLSYPRGHTPSGGQSSS